MSTPSECSLPIAISAAAVFIAQNLNTQELSILAAALTQLADTLATIAVTRVADEDSATSSKDNRCRCSEKQSSASTE